MTELDTLLPLLATLPPTAVVPPSTPMAVALQEAHDLHAAIQTADTRDRLLHVGVPASVLDALPVAVAATRQAQSQWVVERDRGKRHAQRERERAGAELRAELVAACRWSLRRQPAALAVVEAIVRGEGTPDLVQELSDLAALIRAHAAAFDHDATFDAPAQAEAARSAAAEIAAGRSDAHAQRDRKAAKDLRDRAHVHMAALVAEIREAGRYAFRKEPQRLVAFGSTYLRKVKARSRRKSSERNGSEAIAIITAT